MMYRGADNHSPTRKMRVKFRLGDLTLKPHSLCPLASAASVFPSFTDSTSPDSELFSHLASENCKPLASLASVWKNLDELKVFVFVVYVGYFGLHTSCRNKHLVSQGRKVCKTCVREQEGFEFNEVL
jgi:hypothetical protein